MFRNTLVGEGRYCDPFPIDVVNRYRLSAVRVREFGPKRGGSGDSRLTAREIWRFHQSVRVCKSLCDSGICVRLLVGGWRKKEAGILLDTGFKLPARNEFQTVGGL